MAISSPTFKPTIAIGATSVTIVNVVTVLGVAEILLPPSTKGVTLRARTLSELKISSSLNGDYITMLPRTVLTLTQLEITNASLHIISNVSTTMIEALITHG